MSQKISADTKSIFVKKKQFLFKSIFSVINGSDTTMADILTAAMIAWPKENSQKPPPTSVESETV